MIIITAVDDGLGMMFNHRRLSKDEELKKYILRLTAEGDLYMNEYSAKQFADISAKSPCGKEHQATGEKPDQKELQDTEKFSEVEEFTANIIIDEMFLDKAGEDDYCFVENLSIEPYMDKINKLVLCKWNRKYPSDMKLVFPFEDWRSVSAEDFPGKSHEMITVETWEKKVIEEI